jgi:TonB family protein
VSALHASRDDTLGNLLLWSSGLHAVFFLLLAFVALARPKPPIAPVTHVAFVLPGGPVGAMGGGSSVPAPRPAPAPPKTEEKAPRVVRPTKEERQQIPTSDAKTRSQPAPPPKPTSGLVGKDAASAPSAQLQGGAATDGLGLGGAGGGSPFDSDFEYDYYAVQMLAKIRAHWNRVAVRGRAVVIVQFTIFKDGHLEGIEVEQSSGVSLLDRTAERAVYLADPLPPLPHSFPRDRVGVHLRFTYEDQ